MYEQDFGSNWATIGDRVIPELSNENLRITHEKRHKFEVNKKNDFF